MSTTSKILLNHTTLTTAQLLKCARDHFEGRYRVYQPSRLDRSGFLIEKSLDVMVKVSLQVEPGRNTSVISYVPTAAGLWRLLLRRPTSENHKVLVREFIEFLRQSSDICPPGTTIRWPGMGALPESW